MKQILFFVTLLFTFVNTNAQTKTTFSIKNNKNLPKWFENVERSYMLNDDRIDDEVKYIGGCNPKIGEIFFINNKEVLFSKNKIKTTKVKNIITRTFASGDYLIIMKWDTNLTTGAYSEGSISLKYKNKLQFNSPLVISGF
ncbi:hypothetical protein [Flavobacterium sp.]|jgi:hypothetical protein|uniref:hypothetical protein n=1 Tax=Flavobacterium sp. TaxID=239 RepID=UPI0037C16DA4